MEKTEKYNGWANYETWNISLWITNEEWSDSYFHELSQECYDDAIEEPYFTKMENAVISLTEKIKEWVEENNPLSEKPSCYGDLLQSAIDNADFREIAENFLSDVNKEENEEDNE